MPLVQVKLIKGVFDQDQKQEIITKMTETMVGIEGETMRSVTRVIVEEVESGEWASAGSPVDPGRQGPPGLGLIDHGARRRRRAVRPTDRRR